VDVGAEVLAKQVEAASAAAVRQVARGGGAERPLGPRLDAPDLAIELRRHVETLQEHADTVKHGANLARTLGALSARC
jgi:hypothetical protein